METIRLICKNNDYKTVREKVGFKKVTKCAL